MAQLKQENEEREFRIICISDTHNGHKYLTQQLIDLYESANDILIHCGDMTNRGSKAELSSINKWFGLLPYSARNTFVISGNMDGFGLENKINGKDIFTNAIYLEHELHCFEQNKLKIFGTPFTPRFVGGFQLKNEKESKQIFDAIPNGIDILICHGPPFGILDKTSKNVRVGDKYLAQRVFNEIKPKLMVFGHIHESHGQMVQNDILFVNAAMHNAIHLKNKNVKPIVVKLKLHNDVR